MTQLSGKFAVITGGTQGLGVAIARLFAERGAAGIVTCGRTREKGLARAREIEEETGTKIVFSTPRPSSSTRYSRSMCAPLSS